VLSQYALFKQQMSGRESRSQAAALQELGQRFGAKPAPKKAGLPRKKTE